MPPSTEMIDVVDENGAPTGKAKPRALVHRDGDWHRTVHVWVANAGGEILFQKRSLTKESFPGSWDVSAAGHIESGETSVHAAAKELREELGIDVSPQDLRLLFTEKGASVQNRGTFIDNEISDVYVIRIDIALREILPQEAEVSDVRFVPCAELERLARHRDPDFVPHDREYRRLFEYFRE